MQTTATLPLLSDQAERLLSLGVHELAGLSAADFRAAAASLAGAQPADALLVVHPDLVPPSRLAPLLRLGDQAGFVVADLDDVDAFAPIPGAEPPPAQLYLVTGPERGDALRNWSPDEALPELVAAGRTPLTLAEGLSWLLQQPAVLERGHCFMTLGSRLHKPDGRLDPRTPAVWISNGTGRDGPARRNAPKVGWCWAGNRHTWLGFASAAARAGGWNGPGASTATPGELRSR